MWAALDQEAVPKVSGGQNLFFPTSLTPRNKSILKVIKLSCRENNNISRGLGLQVVRRNDITA